MFIRVVGVVGVVVLGVVLLLVFEKLLVMLGVMVVMVMVEELAGARSRRLLSKTAIVHGLAPITLRSFGQWWRSVRLRRGRRACKRSVRDWLCGIQ